MYQILIHTNFCLSLKPLFTRIHFLKSKYSYRVAKHGRVHTSVTMLPVEHIRQDNRTQYTLKLYAKK